MINLGSGESKLETAISVLLIAGIAVSLSLILVGLVFFYHSFGNLGISLNDSSLYIHGQNFFSFIYDLITNRLAQGNAILFISLGIAALLLTVYIRVILSLIYFALKKDIKFTVLTAFVFVAITISMVLH